MANEELWTQLLKLDGRLTAQKAKCGCSDSQNCYTISLLNEEYTVDLSKKQVLSARDLSPASFAEELCILAYLINAHDVPIADRLTPAESLPGGQFFFRGLHKLPTDKLEEVFSTNPERLYALTDEFGAQRCNFGDASIRLYVLPRVPLTIVIWRADEEFPARASILFDHTAASQLPLDALGLAANLTVNALTNAARRA